MAILKVNDVTKKFGSVTTLDGIRLELRQGESYGFIGPNGAGKTSTLWILLGMIVKDRLRSIPMHGNLVFLGLALAHPVVVQC